jgi:hypothetical protein
MCSTPRRASVPSCGRKGRFAICGRETAANAAGAPGERGSGWSRGMRLAAGRPPQRGSLGVCSLKKALLQAVACRALDFVVVRDKVKSGRGENEAPWPLRRPGHWKGARWPGSDFPLPFTEGRRPSRPSFCRFLCCRVHRPRQRYQSGRAPPVAEGPRGGGRERERERERCHAAREMPALVRHFAARRATASAGKALVRPA